MPDLSSDIQTVGINFAATREAGHAVANGFGRDYMKAAIIATGGLSGGISSTIAGGNFWDGFRQGIITSGLNHVAHMMTYYADDNEPPGKKYTYKDAKARWQSRKGGIVDVDASTIDWSKADLLKPGNVKGTYRVRLDGTNRVNTDDALIV